MVRCLLTPEVEHLIRLTAKVPLALNLVLRHDVRDLVELGLCQLDISRGEVLERSRRFPVDDIPRPSKMIYKHKTKNQARTKNPGAGSCAVQGRRPTRC